MSRRTPSQSRLFYTSIETIFPVLTVNLLTVLVFIIDILTLGCSPEKIFYAPRLGATYRSPAGRIIEAGAFVLSLRRTATHSLGSGALVWQLTPAKFWDTDPHGASLNWISEVPESEC